MTLEILTILGVGIIITTGVALTGTLKTIIDAVQYKFAAYSTERDWARVTGTNPKQYTPIITPSANTLKIGNRTTKGIRGYAQTGDQVQMKKITYRNKKGKVIGVEFNFRR